MRANIVLCLLASLVLVCSVMAEGPPALVVEARLQTPVSSYRTRAGAEIKGLVATPLCRDGADPLPGGIIVNGSLKSVHKVGLGLIHESAGLAFSFDELRFPDGASYPIEARLVGIDNARERVDRRGAIHGIRATDTISNRFGERLIFSVVGHPAVMVPLLAIETGLLRFPDPEIEYGVGTELHLRVQFPDSLGTVSACPAHQPELDSEDSAALERLVDALPLWSYSKRQPQPMDLVNLLFVGSEQEVHAAFAAAGWSGARPNSVGAGLGALRAIAENNAFDGAPMRTLLLEGAEPDFTFQKTLNTFDKRHHLRVWKRPGSWEDRPVLASAATRDIGTTFAVHPFGFTHQIQNQVDLERDKVVSDLRFTGCVDSVRLVPRSSATLNAAGDRRRGIRTDGRVAVVVLNSCESPRIEFAGDAPQPPPLLVRCIRRVTLTTRNHFLRDNIIYRSGDAARVGFLAFRNWLAERKSDRAAPNAFIARR